MHRTHFHFLAGRREEMQTWETIGKKCAFLMAADTQSFQGLNHLRGKVGKPHRGFDIFFVVVVGL